MATLSAAVATYLATPAAANMAETTIDYLAEAPVFVATTSLLYLATAPLVTATTTVDYTATNPETTVTTIISYTALPTPVIGGINVYRCVGGAWVQASIFRNINGAWTPVHP